VLKKLFLWIILTIGISLLFYLNENEANAQQVPDIVFETTNASAQPFDDHNFILNIDNLNKNKEICISRDCSFEIIKFHDSGHPAGGVSVPTPEIQSMYSGVDFRIYDTVYKNMSGLEREYQERWRIWANCDTKEIKKDEISICVKNEYDKITILNDFQGIEIPLSLVSGTYDPKSNVIKFTANFVE
jgi:hypothetical protein